MQYPSDMIAYIMACYTSCGALAGMIPVTKLGTIIKNTVNHKEKRQIGFMFFAPKSLYLFIYIML